MWTAGKIDLGRGRSLAYAQGGSGPDLLLIHGALTTQHDWLAGPAGSLSASHRVTVIDRPGHGASRRPRFAGTPRDQAAQIVEGLDRLGIARTTIAAHSFGAMVALAMAEGFPERVARLVLVAPIVFPEPRLMEHLLFAPRALPLGGPLLSWVAQTTRFDRVLVEYAQRIMFSPAPVPAKWRDTYPWDAVLDADAMVYEGEDAATMLPMSPAGTIDFTRVRAPVHVLAGALDRVVKRQRQGKALARLIPDARLTDIPEAGHMLHHSHPAEVIEAVEAVGKTPLPSRERDRRRKAAAG